jgi:hypothetical protein
MTPRAVARRHGERDEVGELGERRLAHDDRARLTQLARDERVVGRNRSRECDRTRGGRHVERVDVVLEQDGDAFQRPPRPPRVAVQIVLPCLDDGAGIDVDERVHGRAGLLVRRDAREVHLHQLFRADQLRLHGFQQIADRGLDELKTRGALVLRRNRSGVESEGRRREDRQPDDEALHVSPS